jgi:SAM-dependent methyltransferase
MHTELKYKGLGGASKALNRRGEYLNNKVFQGKGLDIGAGHDGIAKHGFDVYEWDLKDGDAELLASVPNNFYDFVHSSHCLEHMRNVGKALDNWIRVCKPGGYITIIIPDEELYERNNWPSKFNTDHKYSFRIYTEKDLHKKHINVLDMVVWVAKTTEIIQIVRIEEGFDPKLPRTVDQTANVNGPECSIEIILRKK